MALAPAARMGLAARGRIVSGPTLLRAAAGVRSWQPPCPRAVAGARMASGSMRVSRVASKGSGAAPSLEAKKKMAGQSVTSLAPQALGMIVPGTFILPQLAGFPKPLGDKLRFLGQWILVKFQEVVSNSSIKWSSKPTFFTRAQLKARRSTLIPTAKALHRSMAEALAAGDKAAINRICSQNLAISLCASIDSRPAGRRYGWELVSYTRRLFYPSIRSHRMSPLGMEKTAPIVRQVVVAISSRQRRVVYDKDGNVVPGSEKEMEVVENVAMGCIIDPRTWQQSEWRLIGTVKPTTYDGWAQEKKALAELLKSR
ncbi:hypothetical protein VTJ83DRAFT_1616 [Remersonia thermophila]|uniref:Tim44-like domain-containing protein n=1 Tax=Remersonia thermophila TaxID=72144 RepID=A0ABR4DIQ7_9PEZI